MIKQKARLIHRPKQIRTFECPVCGTKRIAPQYLRETHIGHIKTMWCFHCACERDFVQIA